MTDFYTQLEGQLVAAGHRRLSQGRAARAFAGRGRALVVATCALALLGAGVAVGLPAVFDTASSTNAPAAPDRRSAPAPTASGASLAGIRVAVFNATTRTGLARGVASELERRGAVLVGVSGVAGSNTAQTVVTYRDGARRQARRVAAALGGVPVRPTGAAAHGSVTPVVVFAGLDLTTSPRPVVGTPPEPAVPDAPALPPRLTGIAITVLNATSRANLASSVARLLRGFDARRVVTGDGGPRGVRRTTVYYRPGARAKAMRVADALGVVPVRPYTRSLGAGNEVIVVVGLDWLRLVEPAASPKQVPPTPTAPLPARPARPIPAPTAKVPAPPAPAQAPLRAPAATVPTPSAPPAAPPHPAEPVTP